MNRNGICRHRRPDPRSPAQEVRVYVLTLPSPSHAASVLRKYPATLAQPSAAQTSGPANRGSVQTPSRRPGPGLASTQDAQRPPRAGRRRGRAGDEGHRAAARRPRPRAGGSAAVSSPATPLRHQDPRSARMQRRPPLVFIPGEPGHAPPPLPPLLPVPPRPALSRPERRLWAGLDGAGLRQGESGLASRLWGRGQSKDGAGPGCGGGGAGA